MEPKKSDNKINSPKLLAEVRGFVTLERYRELRRSRIEVRRAVTWGEEAKKRHGIGEDDE